MLMLAGPLFMLQVYDRVLTSGSIPDADRDSVVITAATLRHHRHARTGALAHHQPHRRRDRSAAVATACSKHRVRKSLATQGAAAPALRELDSFRQFISGPAPITFFDAPWTPVYLLVIFMTHWTLGIAATIGTVILLVPRLGQRASRPRAARSKPTRPSASSLEMAETGQRNAEAITAMGMLGAYRTRWQQLNGEGLGWQLLASDRLGGLSAVTKTMRLLLQSLMLAHRRGARDHGRDHVRLDHRRDDHLRPRAGAGRADHRPLARLRQGARKLSQARRHAARTRRRSAAARSCRAPRASSKCRTCASPRPKHATSS